MCDIHSVAGAFIFTLRLEHSKSDEFRMAQLASGRLLLFVH